MMATATSREQRLWTEEELQALPDDGFRHEVVGGESVEVCYSLEKRRLVGSGQELDGEHLLPGFHHPVAALFKEWDWE